MSLELRAAIRFLWLKHTLNQAILSKHEGIYGKDVITLRTIEKWTAAFNGWRTGLANLPKSGRRRDTGKVGAVRVLTEGEGCLSQKKIAQMLGVHHKTIKRLLRDDLTMRKVNFKWVLHALGSSQKAVGVQVSREPMICWKAAQTEVC
jgi:transposase